MENSLEYIDAYFSGALDPEERKEFEQRIADDKNFADDVAFYLSARQVLQEESVMKKKEWFRQLVAQSPPHPIRKTSSPQKIILYRLAAAAAIVGVIFLSWYLFFQKPTTPTEMADVYVNKNLQTLSVTMSAHADSMQEGLRLYNERKFDKAATQFESIAQRDTANFSAKKYAGIVYLRLADYDKALLYFQELAKYKLKANPAIFYQALTLLKRNAPGDKQQAVQLLQRVIHENLEGRETAQQWLKNL